VEIIPAKPNTDSAVGLKLFGFIAESVFAFIPEPCSGSSRNAVRLHRGIAFTLPRIPQSSTASLTVSRLLPSTGRRFRVMHGSTSSQENTSFRVHRHHTSKAPTVCGSDSNAKGPWLRVPRSSCPTTLIHNGLIPSRP
jgi:hypothetical protein